MKKIAIIIALAFAAVGCQYPDDEEVFSEKGVVENHQKNFRAKNKCFVSSKAGFISFNTADVSISVDNKVCNAEDFDELTIYYGDDKNDMNLFGPAEVSDSVITASLYCLRPGTEYFYKLACKHKYTDLACTSEIFTLTTEPLDVEITERTDYSSKIITITGTFNNTSDTDCEIYCHAALKEYFIGNIYYDHVAECTKTDDEDGGFTAQFEDIDNSQQYYFMVEIVADGSKYTSDIFYK